MFFGVTKQDAPSILESVVLKIFVLNFNEEIYERVIAFQLVELVRPVMNFKSLEELKIQIEKDIAVVELTLP